MKPLTRITLDSNVTGGKPCGESASPSAQILALIASGHSQAAILSLYSYLKAEDIREALVYAAWRVMEINPQILSE